MYKVLAIGQDKSCHSKTFDNREQADKLYEQLTEFERHNIATYHNVSLLSDEGLISSFSFPTEKSCRDFMENCKVKLGREFGDEQEIANATGYSIDYINRMMFAASAFKLTERQGGCWVL